MSDDDLEQDLVVQTALRLLPVPDHEAGFWSRLDATLSAEPPTQPATRAPAPTEAADDTRPVPVVELQPAVPRGVVPPAMRRRSNLVLSAIAMAAAIAVVVAGASLVRSRTADSTDEVADAPEEASADPSTTSISTLSAPDDDPATAVVVAWINAVAEGDIDEAWSLLGPTSQAHWGSASGLADERSGLAEGYGAWRMSEPDQVIVTPLVSRGDTEMVVVTLVGTVEQEGMAVPRADAFPVRLEGDEAELELYASAGVLEVVVPGDAEPDGTRPIVGTDDELVLVVPESAGAPILRLDDGEVVVCGESAGTELTSLEGASGQRCGYAPAGGIPAGDHVLTAAHWSADGTEVTAHSLRFTAG